MRIGIYITARLGSTRLQQKHLKQAAGRPLIHYLIQRVVREFEAEIGQGIAVPCIVTSAEPENQAFEQFEDAIGVFYGDAANIPLRHYQAALNHKVDAIVSVDGDDTLCSRRAMRAVFDALRSGERYVLTQGLPLGLNALGYRRDFLGEALRRHDLDQCDTGWSAIFEEADLEVIRFSDVPAQEDRLRFTLDYDCDYAFFRAIIEGVGEDVVDTSDAELVEQVLRNEWHALNRDIIEMYWTKFNQQRVVV